MCSIQHCDKMLFFVTIKTESNCCAMSANVKWSGKSCVTDFLKVSLSLIRHHPSLSFHECNSMWCVFLHYYCGVCVCACVGGGSVVGIWGYCFWSHRSSSSSSSSRHLVAAVRRWLTQQRVWEREQEGRSEQRRRRRRGMGGKQTVGRQTPHCSCVFGRRA